MKRRACSSSSTRSSVIQAGRGRLTASIANPVARSAYMASPHNARAVGVDKRLALFHNNLIGGIGIVFMSLTNLRPYVIQPVDRRWLPFRPDRPRHTA